MPIYQRNNGIWYIDITTANGKRIRQSSGTKNKREAEELHDKIKHEQWAQSKLDKKPEHYWDEACVRWLHEKSHKKSIDNDVQKIRKLQSFRGQLLSALTRDFIMQTISALDCTDATKNRYFALVRAILRKCEREWGWIERSPCLTLFKEPKRRIRWLRKEEAERLLQNLPPLISDMALFSLMTGLRQNNVLKLTWEQVDLNAQVAWIHADQTKSGHPLGVPLNQEALRVLSKQQGVHAKYVFTQNGKPLNGISSKIWKRALQNAGIENFRWHDLRHTWASWLAQAGVPLMDLQQMGGWESVSMVQRYAHLAPDHLRKNAALLDKL